MKILCIGGSNTYGYDPRSYIGSRYPKEVRWTGRLKYPDVINCGMNGLTVPRDVPVFVRLIEKKNPDLIIVMLGTNDLLEGFTAERTRGQMETFLDAVGALGTRVLLISPPHPDCEAQIPGGNLKEESQKLGRLYRELADEKGCLFADAGEWNIEMTFDGVHFSPAGHEMFARKLTEILERL